MKVVIVYNPRSGQGYGRSTLRKTFAKHGIEIEAFIKIEDGYETKVKKHIKKGTVIAAIGGDGTLSSVAALLINTPATFAPLAGGTLNHFTKDLGVSQELDTAVENLKKAKARKIDVAKVNNTIFLNNSSIGLYPSSLRVREDLEKEKVAKWPAAILASIQAFVRYRTLTVTVEGETFQTPFLFVGNNDYHLTDPAAGGRTHLDSGKLSVYAIATGERWKLLRLFRHAITGDLRKNEELRIWHATTLTVKTKKSYVHISRDGELERTASPLQYEILAQSLQVLL